MGWTTVYITGKADFRQEVRRKLEASDVDFMPGYTEAGAGMDLNDLYWLDESTDIRTFKHAIGSKLVWKYRLKFFTSLEAFIESTKNQTNDAEMTPEEKDLLSRFNDALIGSH